MPLVLPRRLKLAKALSRLLPGYRAEAVNLDQPMALAITDDRTAQGAALFDVPTWQRSLHDLLDRLAEREIDAHGYPQVRFVGLGSCEAAGGGTRRALFVVVVNSVFLTEATLV